MAKKQTSVVYVPISKNIPDTQKVNLDIPKYEDRGIKYLGYAKIPMGSGEYRLKKQETRYYTGFYNLASGTDWVMTRANKDTHVYYITGITLSWRVGAGAYIFLIIYDGDPVNQKFVFWLPPNTSSSQSVDLTSCPRKILGDISFNIPAAFLAPDGVLIYITGFDEEI